MTTFFEYITIFLSGFGGTLIAKLAGDVYDHFKKRIKKRLIR